jgi:GDP-L-fucose synthase
MTILVTGGSGLAGSAIVRELKKANKDVIGISSKNINLLDRTATFNFLKDLKPYAVINAAARVGGIVANNSQPVEFLSQNIQMQTNLIDASYEACVEKFVFLGSSCIYPRDCPQPIKEEYAMTGELETTNSAYAMAKLAGLELIKSYRKEYAKKWITIMPTNLYGPYDNFDLETSHVLPAMVRKFIEANREGAKTVKLWGTGSPRREFLHVDDLAKATIFCLERYDSDQHINIGSGVDLTIKELAEKVAEVTNFSGDIIWDTSRPDGTPRKVLDISKISKLGWSPVITLDQGIASTVKWYQENK